MIDWDEGLDLHGTERVTQRETNDTDADADAAVRTDTQRGSQQLLSRG